MPPQRQLLAIMFTDLVGYTDLMGKDQQKAMEVLQKNRDLQKPLIEQHGGKLIKEMGDGLMVSFSTASEAIQCAHEVQKKSWADEDLILRIGIHLGEVAMEGEDVYGDGVNIASRLQTIADPGGIYISDSIHKAIRGMDITSKYLGELELKNVDYPVKTYAVQGEGLPIPESREDKKLSGIFWAEVKRRGVIRAGIAYLVVSLLLILLFREVEVWTTLPEWLFTALLSVLIVGFPIAIYLAWNYERSPEGFVRTTSKESWQNPFKGSQRKPLTSNIIIISLILIIVFMYIYPRIILEDVSTSDGSTNIQDKSIAVIPFDDMSLEGNQQWFSDGMMDEILTHLQKIKDLEVRSRTSVEQYRNTTKDMPTIGEELEVSFILEGGVRSQGDRFRITVQLIEAETDNHVWSETYDGIYSDTIFTVQSDIANKIVASLDAAISPEEQEQIEKIPTTNMVAYNHFLQAQFQVNKSTENSYKNAIVLFEKAIELDPDFQEAYYGLGTIYSLGGVVWGIFNQDTAWKREKYYLNKALEIDGTNKAIVKTLMAGYFYYEWTFEKVEEYLKSEYEVATNPQSIVAAIGYDYPLKTGRYNQALDAVNNYLQIEPTNGVWHVLKAQCLLFLKEYDSALSILNKSDRLYNDNWWYVRESAKLNYYLDDHKAAQRQVNRLWNNFSDRPPILYWLGAVYAYEDGNNKKKEKYLSQLERMYKQEASGSPAWFLAMFYCHIKEFDKAFYWLERSYNHHEVEMTWLKEEPLLIPVREDPRYQELYRKVGFDKLVE